MSKILVTGAGGLVGSHVIRYLHVRGATVAGLYHSTPTGDLPWPVFVGDLSAHSLTDITGADSNFSVIVHCAASIPSNILSMDATYDVNKKMDSRVLDHVLQTGVRIIFVSTTSIYGCTGSRCTEDHDVNPPNRYAAGKYETERQIEKLLTDYVIMRICAPYGPFQKSRTVLKIFIERAMRNQDLLYYGSGRREQAFTYAEDIAEAVWHCVSRNDVRGLFNIASEQRVSMYELAQLIIQTVPGCRSEIRSADVEDVMEKCNADFPSEKAASTFGWRARTSLKEGILQCIKLTVDEDRDNQ